MRSALVHELRRVIYSPACRTLSRTRMSTSSVAMRIFDNEDEKNIVSCDWLAEQLKKPSPRLVVLDCSWYMPAAKRDPAAEFAARRIPGARFFDIDAVIDVHSGDLPHMLPIENSFAAVADALGITKETTVVAYDSAGLFSAARVWWMFRAFGHTHVAVLDGGLPLWMSRAHDVDTSSVSEDDMRAPAVASAAAVPSRTHPPSAADNARFASYRYPAKLNTHLVWSMSRVLSCVLPTLHTEGGTRPPPSAQIIDARALVRWRGEVMEPRFHVRSGHIPGSTCVPFTDVLVAEECSTLKSKTALMAVFTTAGVDVSPHAPPIVASCGTGVTACILALALHVVGVRNAAVYDGSWTEWGGDTSGAPIATGPKENESINRRFD